jgi:hypothetical protein
VLFSKDKQNCSEAVIDGDLVVMNIATGTFHGLRDVGLDIWHILDSEGEVEAITAILTERYSVDPLLCKAEVDTFLAELLSAKLLVVSQS